MRGYFDGNGSICKYKKDYNVNISSTKSFCDSFVQLIEPKLNIHFSSRLACSTNKITTQINVGGNLQVTKFLDWLYMNSTIHLERKFNIYQTLIYKASSSKSSSSSSETSKSFTSESNRLSSALNTVP